VVIDCDAPIQLLTLINNSWQRASIPPEQSTIARREWEKGRDFVYKMFSLRILTCPFSSIIIDIFRKYIQRGVISMTIGNLEPSSVNLFSTPLSTAPDRERYPEKLNLPMIQETYAPSGGEAAPGTLGLQGGAGATSAASPEKSPDGQLSLSKRIMTGFFLGMSLVGAMGCGGGGSSSLQTPSIERLHAPAPSPASAEAKEQDDIGKLSGRIDTYEPDVIELEKGLTSRPAMNICDGGQGEVKKADYLKEYMKNTGFSSMEEVKVPDPASPDGYHSNLIYRFKGKSSDRTVWFMSHLDVVPPGNLQEWHSNPFEAKVQDGRIYGRGVEDDQQGIVSSVMAMKAFKDSGVVPEHDVGLLFVAEEEIGSEHGILAVMKKYPDIFRKDDIVVVPDGGNKDGTMIETAEKAIMWLKFTTHGKSAHGSRPDLAVNANRAGSAFIVKLNDLYKDFDAKNPVFTPDYSTFEPTERDANVPNINTIPGQDVFYMDCRVLPRYKLDDVLKKIDEIKKQVEKDYGVTIDTEIDTKEDAPPETSPDAPVVKALSSAIKDVYGVDAKPMGIGGGTVAAYIRNSGIPAAVWTRTDETEHNPDENVKISNLLDNAKVFARVIQGSYEGKGEK
jgi:succinyl-diaminopimelate desuccinylase